MRKIVIAVVVTVAAVAGPALLAGAAGAAARAPQVSRASAGGAVTHARPPVRAGSPGMSRALAGSGDQLWRSRFHPAFPGCTNYHANAVAVSPAGDAVFVTGYCDFSKDFFTVAYDAVTGAMLWASRYNGRGEGVDTAEAVAVSPAGDVVYVTGPSEAHPYDPDYATIAYNAATGATLWVSRYNGPAGGGDYARSVAVSPGGDAVYVTGGSGGHPYSYQQYATIAYDAATGATLWVSRYSFNDTGNSDDAAAAVAVSPGGGTVYITGASFGDTSGQDYATVAYNAATGATRWVSRYHGPGNSIDAARSVAVSPGGGTVYVTGYSWAGLLPDYLTAAYDAATGARLWVRRYNGPANQGDYPASMAVSPGGGTVYVTGTSHDATGHSDYATVAYNAATGATLWGKRYNGPAGGYDNATSVAVSPGGGTVYVTGDSAGATSGPDYLTAAYDAATGATLWVRRYNGPANSSDYATSVAVSPSTGTVFVTGESTGAPTGSGVPSGCVTIAYSG